MKESEEFTVGNNSFYVNKKYKAVIINGCNEDSDNTVYISFKDLENFIDLYNTIKE